MKKRLYLIMIALGILTVWGIPYPPYELFPYVAETGDNPPLNYTKVCEPGEQDEKNAAYVILGIPYPRTYQAVAQSYSGDLEIPAMIDELPVRKICDGAFLACQSLTSVKIPATVRELGSRAFQFCTSLTNVTFSEGTEVIGDSVFSNCLSLISVTFPSTLSRLGEGCFERCNALTHVKFKGNAPRLNLSATPRHGYLGEKWYSTQTALPRFTICINPATYGWRGPYLKGAPEKWPVDFGWMQAYPVLAEPSIGLTLSITGTRSY